MIELDKALHTVLSGDSQLTTLAPGGVYAGRAEERADGPLVVWTFVSSSDYYTHGADGGGRCYEEVLLNVKGIAPTPTPKDAGLIAERLDQLLTDGELALSSDALIVHSCRRVGRIHFPETADGGQTYWHSGGRWEFIVSTPAP